MHILGQGVFQCTKIRDYLSDDNLILLYRNICLVLAKACFITLKQRTYLSDAILFFCREIYAYSWPRRVLVYTKIARLPFDDNLILLQRNICLVLAKACFIVQKQSDYLSDDNLILLQRNICLVLAKTCFIVQKQSDYLSDDNLILLYRNIYLVLTKACYIALKQRAYLSDDNLILLQRNIYLVLSKACYITLKQRAYLSDDNLILLQRNICLFLAKPCFSILKQRDYLSDDYLIVLYRNICFVLAKACFTVQNSATTFRMTILFFCIEIYAQSQPRRVICTKTAQLPF